MSSSSISNLWKMLTNLSGTDALLLGFLVLCAVGGVVVAIYIAISAAVAARKERRNERMHPAPPPVNRQT